MSDIDVNPESVRNELKKLNVFKSFGPDGVHPKLLKALAGDQSFVDAIVSLFRVCLDSGTLPKVWKSAHLTALFKSGAKTEPLNYRPISLTCILCKVFERIVQSHILTFLEDKITVEQHGFSKGKSCLTNLLETFDTVIDLLDEGMPVDLFYFDFRKAFDTVPHNRLMLKLKSLGIDGKLLVVLKDFLTDRSFSVCVEGEFSQPY